MSDAWKVMERKVAGLLGGTRIPASGVQTKGPLQGDVFHPTFAIECKYRARQGFHRWFDEIAGKSEELKKTPLLVTKEKGKTGELVTLRLTDFVTLLAERQG